MPAGDSPLMDKISLGSLTNCSDLIPWFLASPGRSFKWRINHFLSLCLGQRAHPDQHHTSCGAVTFTLYRLPGDSWLKCGLQPRREYARGARIPGWRAIFSTVPSHGTHRHPRALKGRWGSALLNENVGNSRLEHGSETRQGTEGIGRIA